MVVPPGPHVQAHHAEAAVRPPHNVMRASIRVTERYMEKEEFVQFLMRERGVSGVDARVTAEAHTAWCHSNRSG